MTLSLFLHPLTEKCDPFHKMFIIQHYARVIKNQQNLSKYINPEKVSYKSSKFASINKFKQKVQHRII